VVFRLERDETRITFWDYHLSFIFKDKVDEALEKDPEFQRTRSHNTHIIFEMKSESDRMAYICTKMYSQHWTK
jgi:hypothetical protein